MNKFTPGPWKVRGQAGYTGHGVNDSTGRSVCSVPSNGNRNHEERNANVALLAAAPELLEALKMALDASMNCIDDHSWEDSAVSAIAKATGA